MIITEFKIEKNGEMYARVRGSGGKLHCSATLDFILKMYSRDEIDNYDEYKRIYKNHLKKNKVGLFSKMMRSLTMNIKKCCDKLNKNGN